MQDQKPTPLSLVRCVYCIDMQKAALAVDMTFHTDKTGNSVDCRKNHTRILFSACTRMNQTMHSFCSFIHSFIHLFIHLQDSVKHSKLCAKKTTITWMKEFGNRRASEAKDNGSLPLCDAKNQRVHFGLCQRTEWRLWNSTDLKRSEGFN